MARGRSLLLLAATMAAVSGSAWLAAYLERGPGSFHATARPLAAAALGAILLYFIFLGLGRTLRKTRPDAARSVVHLQTVAAAIVAIIAIGAVMGGFQSAVVSLGLIGFGLTLALQRPILAVAGWAAMVFGSSVKVGDRIVVGDMQGDVLNITLFSTRLWEIGGRDSNTPGRPTARIVTVNNAVFLEKPVANATSDTPIVFDEFVVNVAFEGDQDLAQEILKKAGDEVLDSDHHAKMADTYRRLTKGLAMERDFPSQPTILAESKPSWMEYRLRYLVDARRAGRTQSRLTDAWTRLGGEHGDALPQVYPRSQPQPVGADGRPKP